MTEAKGVVWKPAGRVNADKLIAAIGLAGEVQG